MNVESQYNGSAYMCSASNCIMALQHCYIKPILREQSSTGKPSYTGAYDNYVCCMCLQLAFIDCRNLL